ncbi:hypothetical protein [Dyadobacter crusticola]|uniref:hypothetical protein n=1 Tax=Dyadobacter crusticola TaxID=292407 RepID=UPI000A9635D6|nr:hypothetical protein [Dyadobacter crusticola]
MWKIFTLLFLHLILPQLMYAQHEHHAAGSRNTGVEPQPLLAQAMRLRDALAF